MTSNLSISPHRPNVVEANLGQLAESVASARPVKDNAQMLVTDHTTDCNQLYKIAQQANLTVPNAIDAEHNKAMIDPFQKLKGAALDQRYIQEMITGHPKRSRSTRKKRQTHRIQL